MCLDCFRRFLNMCPNCSASNLLHKQRIHEAFTRTGVKKIYLFCSLNQKAQKHVTCMHRNKKGHFIWIHIRLRHGLKTHSKLITFIFILVINNDGNIWIYINVNVFNERIKPTKFQLISWLKIYIYITN